MATTVLFVLFVTLLVRATLSFPVSQDIKSVQLSDNVEDVPSFKKTVVFDPDTIRIRRDDTDQVKGLESVTYDSNSVKRTKREIIDGNHSCPEGMKWYWNRCVTLEKYKELKEDEYDDNDDY